ncbi:hypothetical protein GLOTRDRAFT_116773 [Gloeophyllum trabeum ATCC 11539]|uniref:Mediator of RNA polymerase II transcription subunit 19 n=1 Tax=Gloeophyllum trabeum (strain ATCC 11539 / FP-39264 / Madison 617) TaxID=670483 RepID=S7Q3W5_GLOTA|nr:uncharacterized protein GLOTRDRAFT_116773 [Gloeophyllum trabeum ATCC 11539]EPQ54143.1 hypothetical protein GLOTRDRAFT_116773 [Gloeophyllum trabeum ATCC 11539]
MDVDEPMPPAVAASANAIAGPSRSHDPPALYLPPPGPPQSTPPLTSTQDLLARFRLLPAYDQYVRPFLTTTAAPPIGSAPTPIDKGKGKEVATPAAASTPGGPGDGEEEDLRKKKNYKYLIQGIPGKHSMKKDDYLTTMMQVPPKQRIAIVPFDARTQIDAFTVPTGGLVGWNINSLIEESPQAREDRKRRKEMKRQMKEKEKSLAPNGTTVPGQAPGSSRSQSIPPSNPGGPVTAGNTPRTGTARPNVPHQQTQLQSTGTPAANGTASRLPPATKSASTPRGAPTPSTPSQDPFSIRRSKKREHEDNVGHANSQGPGAGGGGGIVNGVNGHANVNGQAGKGSGKPGMNGVRPRPQKKQRIDMRGQAREMPVQQPTPQGV